MKNQLDRRQESPLKNSVLKSALFFSLISLLALSKKTDTAGTIDTGSPATFHFATAADNHFFEPQKQNAAPGIDKLKQSDWYSSVVKNMEESEYHFSKVENTNNYSTPNRKNNLRFYYDENGFSVEPRTTQIPVGNNDHAKRTDEVKYKTLPSWKVNFQLDKKQISKGIWEINENKAEYKTDNITVQYINSLEGMRQNFIVQKPLTDDKNLKLNFSVKTTLKQRFSSDRLQFAHPQSGVVLNYEQLKVWDANGNILAAAFVRKDSLGEKRSNGYCINVNTVNATYPITVDPISITPATMIESNRTGAQLGYSVASAGDVNGDGYSDVIVGAPFYDNGQFSEGAAFIYHGSATGINTTAASIIESNQISARLSHSVASAGDVNGDGYSDVILGAFLYDNDQSGEGAAFIYHGSATGINTTAVSMVESNQASAQLGYSVASAGDVNGDGYSDVIVGAPSYTNGQNDEGAAFIYHGSATGINTTVVVMVESNQLFAQMGSSVASAGDVNGDGYSDVIVGAFLYDNGQSAAGGAFIYHGSATGINTTAVSMVESNQVDARLGYSVAGAGDVNGDGYSDVIIGAIFYDNGENNEGAVFIYHGSATGINTTAVSIVESNQVDAQLGYSVAGAGDVNGDGYSDVVVGVPFYDNGQDGEGAASIYYGSAAGINTTAVFMVESDHGNAQMGYSVASTGDVNGDGYSDIIVGARAYYNIEINEGAAFIYHGSPTGISNTAAVVKESNQVDANMGCSVAGTGDVNGDGYNSTKRRKRSMSNRCGEPGIRQTGIQ